MPAVDLERLTTGAQFLGATPRGARDALDRALDFTLTLRDVADIDPVSLALEDLAARRQPVA